MTTVGYRDSLSYACSSPSGHPSSRFAVRYVHEFCLMLLPDAPSLRLPLPCWCSPSVPITVAFLPSVGVPCPAHAGVSGGRDRASQDIQSFRSCRPSAPSCSGGFIGRCNTSPAIPKSTFRIARAPLDGRCDQYQRRGNHSPGWGWGTMERKRTLRGSGREFDTIAGCL